MFLAGRERGDELYVDEDVLVEIPFNGSTITIKRFFLCASSVTPYSIATGIGRNGEHQVLVGRALVNGRRQTAGPDGIQTKYRGVPISDYHATTVRQDLEAYRQTRPDLADAEIAIWPELLQNQK